jgi:hypothetical protein
MVGAAVSALRGQLRLPGYKELPERPEYVTGYISSGGRLIPLVSTNLSFNDRFGGFLVRWRIGRDRYAVAPGLYAVGAPGTESPVLVTANYKLTFDTLRRELEGISAWILVLDTKGVNVWCAAGKGTFGAAELLDKIARLRLSDIVSHRLLILPQLGATGVSAPEIARVSQFRVIWGPVRASDIPAFLASGMRKDERMRRVEFRLGDRLRLAPVELVHAWPFILVSLVLAVAAAFPIGEESFTSFLWTAAALLGSVLVGALLFPALLPFLPTRAFAVKGAFLGLLWTTLCVFGKGLDNICDWIYGTSLVLIGTPISAFIAMNFTGSSTFTSQGGAQLEVERGLIPMIASAAAGIALGCAARLCVW